MTSTIAKVEEDLAIAGYKYPVPLNDRLFAVGDGDLVDDAPLGYYRFHFWKNDETMQEHENYLALTEGLGPICISLQRHPKVDGSTTGFSRLLIRSVFGHTSVVIEEEPQQRTSKHFRNVEGIIEAALTHLWLHERSKVLLDEDCCETISICSVAPSNLSTRTERTKFLPISRLKGMEDDTGICRDLSTACSISRRPSILRRGSMSIGSNLGGASLGHRGSAASISIPPLPAAKPVQSIPFKKEDWCLALSAEQKMQLLDSLKPADLAPLFIPIKDKDLPRLLLSMEQSLIAAAPAVHVDIVVVRREGMRGASPSTDEDHWEAFAKGVLGERLAAAVTAKRGASLLCKNGRIPSEVISSLLQDQPKLADLPRPKIGVRMEDLARGRWNAEEEMLNKEQNYIDNLSLILDRIGKPVKAAHLLDPASHSKIFGGFDELISLHRELLQQLTAPGRTRIDYEAFLRLTRHSKRLHTAYIQYGRDYSIRLETLKQHLSGFRDLCQSAGLRQPLEQLMVLPIQHISRYGSHLQEIARYVCPSDPVRIQIADAYAAMCEVALVVDRAKSEYDGTVQMFQIQSQIFQFPATLISPTRRFLCKMAVLEDSHRLCLFLFNDVVLLAAKNAKNESTGGNSKRSSICRYKYTFVLSHPIQQVELRPTRISTGNGTKDSIIFELKESSMKIRTLFPKNPSKLESFLKTFKESRHAQTCEDSPAINYYLRDGENEIYFHAFELADWQRWPSKSPMVLFYSEQTPVDLLALALSSDHPEISTCGVVQARGFAYRTTLRMRNLLFASPSPAHNYTATSEFLTVDRLAPALHKALSTAQRLINTYPPHSKAVEHQMRLDLVERVRPFGKTVGSRLRSLASSTLLRFNKAVKTVEEEEVEQSNQSPIPRSISQRSFSIIGAPRHPHPHHSQPHHQPSMHSQQTPPPVPYSSPLASIASNQKK